jgi:hypothetical protein
MSAGSLRGLTAAQGGDPLRAVTRAQSEAKGNAERNGTQSTESRFPVPALHSVDRCVT